MLSQVGSGLFGVPFELNHKYIVCTQRVMSSALTPESNVPCNDLCTLVFNGTQNTAEIQAADSPVNESQLGSVDEISAL